MKKMLKTVYSFLIIIFLPIIAFIYFIIKMPAYLFKANKIVKEIKKDRAEAIKNRLIKEHHLN